MSILCHNENYFSNKYLCNDDLIRYIEQKLLNLYWRKNLF